MKPLILKSEENRQHAMRVLSQVPLDKPKVVQIEELRAKRTNAQNARLWKLHSIAADKTGYSPEEMHEHALCRHFGYVEKRVIDPFTGEVVTKRTPNKRSSTRETKEFAEFMTATEAWYITEFGVWLDQ